MKMVGTMGKIDDSVKKKVPELRFPGFTDDWEERKLGEITEYIKGFAFKSKDYKKSGYRIIRVSDLGKESIKNSNDSIFTSEEIAIQQKKYKIKQDEIIITTVGSKAEMKESAVGRPIIISESLGYLLNQNLVKIYGKENYSNYFIYSQLLQPRYSDYISMIQRGNANQANIAINDLWEFQISIPEIEEQQKIGSFFKQLDDTIALHQRKLAKLKELKQGYLQKLFPQNGSKFPQLRFAGFADAWEQRKLGEVATFLNGRAYKQDELLDSGKYKVLRVGNFYTNDSWYYSNMELGDKYYVDKGDLVYTWSATFGPHIWSGEKVIYHYHIWKVELSKFLDRNFTLQLLEADKARLLSSTNGSTMIHVTKGDMESKIVSIPNIDEQKQIGSFFKQLDNTITLHQGKLEKLQELKKGYLQKMFC